MGKRTFTQRSLMFSISGTFLLGIGLLFGLGISAMVSAQEGIPDADGVIHSCYLTHANALERQGNARVVSDPSLCKTNETVLFWNQEGPQGAPGIQGPMGPEGPAGSSLWSQSFDRQGAGPDGDIFLGASRAIGDSNVGIGTDRPDSPFDVQAEKSGFAANITNHGSGTGLAITALSGDILALANAQGIITTFANDGSLIVSEYVQLALTTNAPPAGDCDEVAEAGRMKFDSAANLLYLCSGASGWISK